MDDIKVLRIWVLVYLIHETSSYLSIKELFDIISPEFNGMVYIGDELDSDQSFLNSLRYKLNPKFDLNSVKSKKMFIY